MLAIAAALVPGLAGPAAAHQGEAQTAPGAARSLFQQGLLPSSTGLRAPVGDRVPAPATADAQAAARAAEDPPLRVYVLVVDGLLPTQVGLATPNLNALKQGGTWWEEARAVLPAETLPNHAAMATGVIPQRNGIVANQFDRGQVYREYMQYPEFWQADTITTRLERAYDGAVDTATIMSKEYLYGVFRGEYAGAADPSAQLEADFHWDPRAQPAYVVAPSSHATDVASIDALLGWIRAEADSPRPQFAFVNLGDVDRSGHADVEGVAPAIADRAASGDDELSGAFVSPFQQAAIDDTDAQIGRVVTELKDTGKWDESVLIVLSDHGMDWSPANQAIRTQDVLEAAGYRITQSGRRGGEFGIVQGGGSELVYVEDAREISPMARILCAMDGVAVVVTREPIAELGGGCRGRTQAELGIEHPFSPEISLFLEPGWRSLGARSDTPNVLPGNHGHGITQHSTLMVAGGHPALADGGGSVGGERVYRRGELAAPSGPGVLSVAPTVAGLFGIGSPAGGYDAPPLREAFDAGAVELTTSEPVAEPPAGGGEDDVQGEGRGALVTVGSDVAAASLQRGTYAVQATNVGDATAGDVVVTVTVPANTTFEASQRAPLAGACAPGAAAGTACRFAVGDLPAGASVRFDVTYALAPAATSTTNAGVGSSFSHTVSVQRDGAAPAAGDPSDTDASLLRVSSYPFNDAHVDDAAPPGTNYGRCDRLQLGELSTAFIDTDNLLPTESGESALLSQIVSVWGAELQATVAAAAEPATVGVHRVTSRAFTAGPSDCAGVPPAGQAPAGRDARTGVKPVSAPEPLASATAAGAGERLRWDVRDTLDTFGERRDMTGFELRAGGPLTLYSGQATPVAVRPRLEMVFTRRRSATCVAGDRQALEGDADRRLRVRAFVTDGVPFTVDGQRACGGSPVAGSPVGWELDDDDPDAYVASAAGVPLARTTGRGGSVGPDRVSTVTGPRGRTYIDVRAAAPYESGRNEGAIGVAAIALQDTFDGYTPPGYGSNEGACEPGTPGAGGRPHDGCTGEDDGEDDVVATLRPVAPPVLSIDGVAVAEGDAGSREAELSLRLSRASELPVEVTYATSDGTARTGSDYSGVAPTTVTFEPGQTLRTIRVPLIGDTVDEPDEAFTVALSAPGNASLGPVATATVSLTDDDPAPKLSIGDVTSIEGDSGATRADFTVSLAGASDRAVQVDYVTADGTAAANGDYEPRGPSTLTFAPGQAEQTVSVPVQGDTADEPDETFTVTLTAARNGVIARGSATGTILDDDGPTGPLGPPAGGGGSGGVTGPGGLQGGQAPTGPACSLTSPFGAPCPLADTLAPVSRFVRTATRASRRGLTLRGTSRDLAPGGLSGRPRAVYVAVLRATGSGCRSLKANGRFTPRRGCHRTTYLRAKGTSSFRFAIRGRMPAGRYLAWVRAVDASGNIERKNRRRNLIRFTIR